MAAAGSSRLVLTLSDSDESFDIDLGGAGAGPHHDVTFHGLFHAARLRAGAREAATASW